MIESTILSLILRSQARSTITAQLLSVNTQMKKSVRPIVSQMDQMMTLTLKM